MLLRLLTTVILDPGPLLSALDDSPTNRSGPKVQGAGVHHNPTPGPAGSKFLFGHSWVTLSRVERHPLWGTLGLPILARLYVGKGDIPKLPLKADDDSWRAFLCGDREGQHRVDRPGGP